jgi:hypothetical protein
VKTFRRPKLETTEEQKHAADARRRGWFVDKIMATGRNGFPDRFYAKDGRVVLMEWKRSRKDRTPLQIQRNIELSRAGVEVYVVTTRHEADMALAGELL